MVRKDFFDLFYWKICSGIWSNPVVFWQNTLKILTYEPKDGIIVHVRSTRGALRAVF